MSERTYEELVAAGAPRLQPGLAYRIKVDGDGDLEVRVVELVKRRWWFGTREVMRGYAYENGWHYKRRGPNTTSIIATTCAAAVRQGDLEAHAAAVERRFTGRHP